MRLIPRGSRYFGYDGHSTHSTWFPLEYFFLLYIFLTSDLDISYFLHPFNSRSNERLTFLQQITTFVPRFIQCFPSFIREKRNSLRENVAECFSLSLWKCSLLSRDFLHFPFYMLRLIFQPTTCWSFDEHWFVQSSLSLSFDGFLFQFNDEIFMIDKLKRPLDAIEYFSWKYWMEIKSS